MPHITPRNGDYIAALFRRRLTGFSHLIVAQDFCRAAAVPHIRVSLIHPKISFLKAFPTARDKLLRALLRALAT